jgi:hypothetical protein
VDVSVDLLLSLGDRGLSSRVQTVSLIQWDIPRTFPTLSFFARYLSYLSYFTMFYHI